MGKREHLERLRVVLVSPRNPLNIGAVARAMSNFGFSRLRVVNAYEVAFREARSAIGAPDILARAEEFSSVADAVADCSVVVGTTGARKRELQHEMLRLEQAAPRLRAELAGGTVALLFGSEKHGLSNQDLSHCHWLMRIPTRDEHLSMNLGQAVAICLYELIRSDLAAAPEPTAKATGEQLERITRALADVLLASEYLQAPNDEKIRRFVRRMGLGAEDADVLLGMLRQIAWKIGR